MQLCPLRTLFGGAYDSALAMTAIEDTNPPRALLDGSNDSVRDRNLPIIRSTEQSSEGRGRDCPRLSAKSLGPPSKAREGAAEMLVNRKSESYVFPRTKLARVS